MKNGRDRSRLLLTEKRVKELGARVRECRHARGISIDSLAKLAGTTSGALDGLEHGAVGKIALVDLAAALGVDPWWLIFGYRPDREAHRVRLPGDRESV